MFLTAVSVNYLAILIAAIVAFFIGGLWFSPYLFGPVIQNAYNGSGRRTEEAGNTPTLLGIAFLTYLVTGYVIAILLKHLNIIDLPNALQLVTLVWLGFTAAVQTMHFLFSNRPLVAFLISLSYDFVYIVAMTIIIWWFS